MGPPPSPPLTAPRGSTFLFLFALILSLLLADGPIVTNSRRLLQLDPEVLLASCSKAYRFQWWGWGLQTSFVALVGTYWAARFKHTGIFIIGGCATVLGMIFANEQLQASDDLSGTAFSRAITTFVGW